LSFYSGYDVAALEGTCRKMADILIRLETSKFKTIYNKYLHRVRLSASTAVSTKYRRQLETISRGL
jgi:hypothetical protein